MKVRVLVRFKAPKDWNWREEEFLELTRVPLVGEYISAGPFEWKLCQVTMVVHTPAHPRHEAEIFGNYVEREEAIAGVDNFEL
jgi:hypothetical protein